MSESIIFIDALQIKPTSPIQFVAQLHKGSSNSLMRNKEKKGMKEEKSKGRRNEEGTEPARGHFISSTTSFVNCHISLC